ncbi:MAG: TonB family protein [Acidobacteriota bacterium]|nr:TonB family protein [Acidobacteriota bacterium]
MPLNVKRFCTSVLLTFIFSTLIYAQTSADVMRERVAKAKAYVAIRNYGAAIYELENIRRETNDPTVHSVVNVLLINSFLEQGDYKRAQEFLTALAKKPGASASYLAAAGQVVKGAKNQMDRYRALGLSVSDRNLPKDAVADVDKMRETLEKVVEQTKVFSKDKNQASNAMALMEEATATRGSLARDDFDANRWKNEAADAREDLASSRSIVVNAVSEVPTQTPQIDRVASNTTQNNQPKTNETAPALQPVSLPVENTVAKIEPPEKLPVVETPKPEIKRAETTPIVAANNSTNSNKTRSEENSGASNVATQNKTEAPIINASADSPKISSPIAVGSLINYATQKSNPVYPPMARNMRLTGIVKVELMIDETGQVSQVQNTSGPAMLQRAAMDAARKWKFKPFTRDGQATKATGFVSFNFSL